MSKKVLVTGAAGFIGSNLVDHLLRETDWQIEGVDNLETGNKDNLEGAIDNARFNLIEGNLRQIKSLKPYEVVFHLAALPRIQPSFELIGEHVEANVQVGIHLVELMIRESHFPRFVYSSSSAIYGNPDKTPTDENDSIDCLSPYAFQKYELEKYFDILATRYPLDYIHLRYFNPYGPRSFNAKNPFNAYSSVVGIFLNRIAEGKPVLVTGDGSQQRDFIHVDDIASANLAAGKHPEKINTAFNLGVGKTISILELAKMMSDNYEFIAARDGEAEITLADITKARNILNWQPSNELATYLKAELA